jgi:hypothetical protein
MRGILLLVIRPTTKLRWKSQDENSCTVLNLLGWLLGPFRGVDASDQ